MALTKQISKRSLILSPTTAEVSTAQTIAPYYDFRIDGLLEIPIGETFDCSRHIYAEQTLISARLSVQTGGTSQYRIIVSSYDAAGVFIEEHINTLASPTDSNATYTLAFIEQTVQANTTLVLSVEEEVIGIPAEDLSLTLVSGTFADLDQITNGHVIQNSAAAPVTQRGNLQLAGAGFADVPMSDRTAVTIHPIGGILRADLTDVQFQAQMGTNWIEANGQSSVGTAYQTLTGNAVVPTIVDPDGLLVMIRVD